MAISPKDKIPALQIDLTDPAGYPLGKAQDQTVPKDGTGTPLTEDVVNDIWGHQQALLAAAELTPTGTPDKVGASQYLDAQTALFGYAGHAFVEGSTGSTVDGALSFPGKSTVCRVTLQQAGHGGGAKGISGGSGGGAASGARRTFLLRRSVVGDALTYSIKKPGTLGTNANDASVSWTGSGGGSLSALGVGRGGNTQNEGGGVGGGSNLTHPGNIANNNGGSWSTTSPKRGAPGGQDASDGSHGTGGLGGRTRSGYGGGGGGAGTDTGTASEGGAGAEGPISNGGGGGGALGSGTGRPGGPGGGDTYELPALSQVATGSAGNQGYGYGGGGGGERDNSSAENGAGGDGGHGWMPFGPSVGPTSTRSTTGQIGAILFEFF